MVVVLLLPAAARDVEISLMLMLRAEVEWMMEVIGSCSMLVLGRMMLPTIQSSDQMLKGIVEVEGRRRACSRKGLLL